MIRLLSFLAVAIGASSAFGQFVPRLTFGDVELLPREDTSPLWDESVDGYFGEDFLGRPLVIADPLAPGRWVVGNPTPFCCGSVHVYDNVGPGDNFPAETINDLALPANESRIHPDFGASLDAFGGWFVVGANQADDRLGQVFVFDPDNQLALTINGRDNGAVWGEGFGRFLRLLHPLRGDAVTGVEISSGLDAPIQTWTIEFPFTPQVPEPASASLVATVCGLASICRARQRRE